MNRGSRPEGILRFLKSVIFFEKWGFKVFGYVALFSDLPLPVFVGIRYITNHLEAGELIKTVLKWCRFLLPVGSYGDLNFF